MGDDGDLACEQSTVEIKDVDLQVGSELQGPAALLTRLSLSLSQLQDFKKCIEYIYTDAVPRTVVTPQHSLALFLLADRCGVPPCDRYRPILAGCAVTAGSS